jgi:hypothetical protein
MKRVFRENDMEDFKTMVKMTVDDVSRTSAISVFCDYIAFRIRKGLNVIDPEGIIKWVGHVEYDLDDQGAYAGPKKTLIVEDKNGKKYKVTVEEQK